MKGHPMKRPLTLRLRLMMFLQFFIWGAWYVTVGNYMATVEMTEAIYLAYTVGPFSGLVAPFFLGLVADRFFSAEKVLGVLNVVGGLPLILATQVEAGASTLFVLLLLAHCLCFFPTLGLAASLTFHHITDREKQFAGIRVYGSIGWMAAGVLVSYVLSADETVWPLYIAGGTSVVLGLYSFTLPATPPQAKGETVTVRRIIGLDALKVLMSRSFAVFLICTVLLEIPLAAYFAYAPVFVNAAGMSDPAFKMAFGQLSEIGFMLVLPLAFARMGIKWMFMVGMLAWMARYALFAAAAPAEVGWLIMLGILLHGICFDFTYVAGQVYVDRRSTPAIRGQAQGLLVMITSGMGLLIGAQVSGALFNTLVGEQVQVMARWQPFWLIPAGLVLAVFLAFGVLFREARPVAAKG